MKATPEQKIRATERLDEQQARAGRAAYDRAIDDGATHEQARGASESAERIFAAHRVECDRCGCEMHEGDRTPHIWDEYGEHECPGCYDREQEAACERHLSSMPETIYERSAAAWRAKGAA